MPHQGGAPASNRRRNRIFYKPQQVDQMEAAFACNQYPDFKRRQQLADEIGLTEDRIQVWFQNRRDRQKKQRKIKGGSQRPRRRTLFTKEFMPPNLTSPSSSPEMPSSPEVIDLSTSVPASSPEIPAGLQGISSFIEPPSPVCPSTSTSPTLPIPSSLPWNEPSLPPLKKASDICREVIDWSTASSPELPARLPGISSFVEPPSPVCPSSQNPTLAITSSLALQKVSDPGKEVMVGQRVSLLLLQSCHQSYQTSPHS